MRVNRYAGFVVTTLLLGLFFTAGDVQSDEQSDLYNRATETLGSKNKTIVTDGTSRVMLWKSQVPGELMFMSITGLLGNPENMARSFLAYTISDASMFSSNIYQCSWHEEQKKVFYECGQGMNFPSELRERPSRDLLRELHAVLKTDQQFGLPENSAASRNSE